MKKLLTFIVLSFPLLTSAQLRTGGGPDDPTEFKGPQTFIDIINKKVPECFSEPIKFAHTVEFQIHFEMSYKGKKFWNECDIEEMPPRFRCLLRGEAAKELKNLTTYENPQDHINYYKKHNLTIDQFSSNHKFLFDLNKKLMEDEKK